MAPYISHRIYHVHWDSIIMITVESGRESLPHSLHGILPRDIVVMASFHPPSKMMDKVLERLQFVRAPHRIFILADTETTDSQ